MSGLVDLLFFGLIIWFVLRAAGKAAERMRETGAGGEESTRAAEVGRPGEPRRPPRADTAEGPVRRRLMEELQRWEAEQRGRSAPPSERAGGVPAPVPRRPRPVSGPRDRPPAPRPRLPARASSTATIDEAPRVPSPPATRPGPRPREEVPELGGEDLAVPIARPRGERAGGLPDLSRLGPLQRAIVLKEILGPPTGTRGG